MATHEPEIDEQLHLGLDDHGRALSEDEFADALYDEPYTYELVDGRLVVMSPEGTDHVDQREPWRDRLGAYRLTHPEVVRAVVSQAWTRIDTKNARIADIGVYLGGSLDALDIPHQVPNLIFEFVSPSKKDKLRDYVENRADYEKIRVPEYVIVDRVEKKVTVLTLGEAGYQERVLTSADVYRSPLLPGFEVRLAEDLPR
jgi:Uma2 family endonuclease